ncbi:hypothetical protein G6F42_015430 [Rhizopus arrhizus]|nr:hypothetical protein G6F42_015430 [Rhizopus arrhizus]
MDVTRVLRPFNADEEEMMTEQELADIRDRYKRIRRYLDQNAETLVDSAMTFDEFLQAIEISSVDAYIYSIRSTLKTTKVFLRRTPNQVLTNSYNRKILSIFRSNMDLQFIVDGYACCSYVADYINKADKGISNTLREIYQRQRNDPSTGAFDTLRSIATSYYNAAEISAQEAAYNLLRIRMSEASTVCVFIPTSTPDKRLHILRTDDDLLAMEGNSTDCIQPGLIEHYSNRPDQFEGLNLTQFAAYFDVSRKRPARHQQTDAETAEAEAENVEPNDGDDESMSELPQQPVVDSGVPGRSYQMRAGNPQMWITRRRKSNKAIQYYYKFNKHDETRPDYFWTLLMLYKPWRDEEGEVINVNAEELVNLHNEMIGLAFQEFTRLDEEDLEEVLERVMGDRAENANGDDDGEAIRESRHADDANDFGRYTVEVDDEDEGDFQRNTDIDEDLTAGAAASTSRTPYFEKIKVPGKLPDQDYFGMLSRLNSKQRLLLTHIIHHIRNSRDESRYRYFDTAIAPPTNTTFAPLHLLVTGGAGTGKSMLINTLYQSLIREFDSDRDRDMASPSVLLCAPTGIHVSHSMSVALRDLRVVIIDEISMVGSLQFGWIDKRLRDIFDSQKPFGGISIFVFGDFLQLPPVMAAPVYSRAVSPGNAIPGLLSFNLWSLFEPYKLTQIMRQRDDLRFAVALNHLAIGELTDADRSLFQSRVVNLSSEQMQQIKDFAAFPLPADENTNDGATQPIILCRTNNEVENFNRLILDGIQGEEAVSVAFDVSMGVESQFDQNAIERNTGDNANPRNVKGLIKNLRLKVGGKYIISRNVKTSDGIVNGAGCILKRIDYGRRQDGARKPLRVWVDFGRESCGAELRASQASVRRNLSIAHAWTMIEPVSDYVYRNTNGRLKVRRKQFPLLSAESLTVHKSQGQTYGSVVVIDGVASRSRLDRQLMYVACSRATASSGLRIVARNNTFNTFQPLSRSNPTSPLRMELARQETDEIVPRFLSMTTSSYPDSILVLSHNIQSLRAHLDQVSSDLVYNSASVLLFSETWTVHNSPETFQLPGFELVSRSENVQRAAPSATGACCYVNENMLGQRECMTTDSIFLVEGSRSISVALSCHWW